MERIFSLPLNHDELYTEEISKIVPYHYLYEKEYCSTSLVLYSFEEQEELKLASETMNKLAFKVLRFVQRYLPDLYLIKQLGIHPSLVEPARIEIPYHGVSRQDWIMGEAGPKLIEFNYDTPTGIPETAYLSNIIIDQHSSFEKSSAYMDQAIQESFDKLLSFYQSKGFNGVIAFSCYDWHIEDLYNTKYLIHLVEQLGYQVILAPLEELKVVENEGLFYNNQKIDIWYRLYPLEYLVHDVDDQGFKTGESILKLVTEHKLAVINPCQSLIIQSKGFLALMWTLAEQNELLQELWQVKEPLFSKEEVELIQKYLLPSYFKPDYFKQKEMDWVEKAFFGREGKGTAIIRYNKQDKYEININEDENIQQYYSSQPNICQKLYEMPQVTLRTEGRLYEGYLLTGVFVIGEQFAGILSRVGDLITGDLAYFCPSAVLKEHKSNSKI